MAAKSSSRGSAAASEIRVYIQDDNHDNENIEDQDNIEKISSEESVNSQELEETPHPSNKSITIKQAAALFRRDKFILLQVCLSRSHFSAHILRGKSLELAARVTFARATAGELSSTIIDYHAPFDHVNDSW